MPSNRYLCLGMLIFALRLITGAFPAPAQDFSEDKFRQLDELLPTANAYRTSSGAPGHGYWQQEVDYKIDVEIDDARQVLIGSETIDYRNHSPDSLKYLWLQLDQNLFRPDSRGRLAEPAPQLRKMGDEDEEKKHIRMAFSTMRRDLYLEKFQGGHAIHKVADADGNDLKYSVVGTMMRVDLPAILKPGEQVTFSVDWSYSISDAVAVRTRGGYEYFEDDDNYLYEIAQWFPRLVAYTDYAGWQHKSFLGRGEFTLEFGDYEVAITVPDDHVVASTGLLQNPEEVLNETQRQRLKDSETAAEPIFVVTPEEAKKNEASKSTGKKTWVYHAENVRDYAFASSRKFIWDSWGYHQGDGEMILAMSYYPNEAEPLWSTYSTQAVVHTLETYSKYTFDYPYPVAISVNGPVGGMEYPMICFNGPRTDDDQTYWGPSRKNFKLNKYGLIGVVIHEVGHNYFPMIVNSDERQWTWMDEGLNSFVQSLSEQEWEEDFPTSRGEPADIVEFMISENQVPIMTNSESLLQFGNNAYAKPATALNILRETILGRELFDFAFKEYSQRWEFRRPEPADLFRSLEDASGVDLDWFWRGWFYTTDHVDISIEEVRVYEVDTREPEVEKAKLKKERDEEPETRRDQGFAPMPKRVDAFPALKDFYNSYDPLDVTPKDLEDYQEYLEELDPWEKELLGESPSFYFVDFKNLGGLVMPILLDITYADGSEEHLRLPAEIWRGSPDKVTKLLVRDRDIQSIEVDPYLETADADVDNNHWPRKAIKSRFQLFKDKEKKNPMQHAAEAADGKKDKKGKKKR